MGLVVALHSHHAIVGDDFWSDVSTGNWQTDCQAGRDRADVMVGCLSDKDDRHAYFGRSMGDLVDKGRMTGVEVGFFQRLLELAVMGLDARK